MKLKKSHRTAIVVFCFIFFIVYLGYYLIHANDMEYVYDGELKLTDGLLNTKKWIPMKGDWLFYWKSLDPDDLVSTPILLDVPSTWNDVEIDGKRLNGDGYATYRLKVDVESLNRPLAMRIETFSTAYTCIVDGKIMAQNGIVSEDSETGKPGYNPNVIVFTPLNHSFDILFQVSNYTYARGGFWYDVYIGDEEQIENLNDILLFKDALVIGTLLIMSFYFLNHFILLKRASNGMYFFIMCMMLTLRTGLYGDYLLLKVFPNLPFETVIFLTYFTIIWFPITLVQMLQSFLERQSRIWVTNAILSYGLVATLSIIVLPIKTYTEYITFFELMALIAVLYTIIRVFYAYVRDEFDSIIPLLGATLILSAGIHDVLYQSNVITNSLGEWSSISLVVFMYMLTYLLNKRYSVAYNSALEYSEKLSKSLNEQLALTDELYKLDKVKDQFLANTSHELRTPLNGIINISDSLLKGLGGQLSIKQVHSLEIVKSSADRLYRLINDILDASLIRENKMTLNKKVFDLYMVVDDCLFSLELSKKNEKVTLINSIEPMQFYLNSDEERLKQMIFNLVGNALKFTIEGEVCISAVRLDQSFNIHVKDTGIGISEKNIFNIYNVFEQIDNQTNRYQEGSGLGLYITREVGAYLGAEILVESTLGVGSQFTIKFPVEVLTTEKPLPVEYRAVQVTEMILGNSWLNKSSEERFDVTINRDKFIATALVVDDDDANRTALKSHLEILGIDTIEASNGYDALDKIDSCGTIDLILLDIMMPGLSGFEVLKKIREEFNQIDLPVIMLTARINPIDIEYSMSIGANDYLAKPYDVNELYARVKNVLSYSDAYRQFLNMELSFLQAQIKPHFIFNALSTISSLTLKEPLIAKELILDMADYLRLSFDFEKHTGLSSLTREIELVKAYLAIEKVRFGNRLQVTIDIAEDIDCTLPILCIQPLVENAVNHGVMCIERGGCVNLGIDWVENFIRISISDTGVGINQQVIDMVNSQKQMTGHVGLRNIHSRLKKLYGTGLKFSQSDAYNTIIYFDVPYISKEAMDESFDR